jgi:hypothetical protein
MIFHINRTTFKSGLSEEYRRACVDAARQASRINVSRTAVATGPTGPPPSTGSRGELS